MKRVLSIIAASIVVIAVAFAVFIKIYITPERVKTFLVPVVENALNRKVNIGEVNISLFKGIKIKDFAVKETDDETDFVKCKDFVLKFKLLPLLYKKVIIDVKILSPEIRFKRNDKGKFNFEGIGQKQKTSGVKEEEAIAQKGLPVSLLISRIVIKDGSFSLTDHKKELPDIKGSVDINTGIKSSGDAELFSEGDIALRLDEIVIKEPYKKLIKDITAGLKYAVSVNLKSNSIHIDKADIKVQKISASIKGDVTNIKTAPEINIAVSIPKIKSSEIQKSLAPFADTKVILISGDLTADLKLTGDPQKYDSLKTEGRVILGKVGFAYDNVTAMLDGSLKFNKQLMTIDLKGTVGKNRVGLKGSINNYFKNQKIKLNLYSKKLFLDEIIPVETAKGSAPSGKDKPVSVKASVEAKPLDFKLTAYGEVKIDSARYKGMVMNDLHIRYQLKDNRFEIKKMTAHVGKGIFNLKSVVDFSKPGYTYNLSCRLDSLHVDEIVNSFFPKAEDTVYGVLSSNFKLSGSGTLPENIKKNLVANGDFNINNGKITNNKIAEKFSLFLGIDELKTINLRHARGTVKIKNGIARLDSIFSSDDISMNPSGSIGLDETLALAFGLKLSPRLTDRAMMKSDIATYMKDDEGWGRIPLKVSGTFADPSYSIDIEKAGKRVLKKKAKELIEDIFDKGKGFKNPLKDLLKGVLD